MTNDLQNALEKELDNLLEDIKGEWNESMSRSEELFFRNLSILYEYDSDKTREYSNKYNDVTTQNY